MAPRRWKDRPVVTDSIPDFSGGVNTVSSDVALAPNQMREATNARLTQFGAVLKRKGTQRMTSNVLHANGIQGLAEWALSSGTRYLICAANGGLSRGTYGAFPITFSAISGALATSGVIDFAAFRDLAGSDALYVADGGLLNKLVVTAGPTFTLTTNIASTPSATVLEVFNARLWACGDATYPQAVFYSGLNDGDSLGIGASGGGQINVRTFGQQNVTAIKALGTSLLIFHRGGVSRLTGFGQDDTVALPAAVTGEVGTTAPASVVRVGTVVYYVNVRGLFMATADGVAPVNTPDRPDPLSPILPNLSATQLAEVSAVFSRATNELWIHVPTVGTFVYHTILGAWAGPWVGAFSSNAMLHLAEVGAAADAPVVIKGDSSGWLEATDLSSAYMDNIAADDSGGVQFACAITVRRMFSGDFADAKSYRWSYIIADLDGSTASVLSWQTGQDGGEVALEQDTGSAILTEGGDTLVTESGLSLVSATSTVSLRNPMWGIGYYADVTLSDSATDATPSFSRVEIQGFSMGRR